MLTQRYSSSSPLHNEGQRIWLVGRPILTNPKTKQFCTLQNSLSSVVVVVVAVLGLCISNLTFFEVVNLLLLHQSCFGDFKIWPHFGSFFSDRYKMEQFVACTLTHSRLFLFALFPYRKPPTRFKHSREAPTSTKMEFCCVWGFRVQGNPKPCTYLFTTSIKTLKRSFCLSIHQNHLALKNSLLR